MNSPSKPSVPPKLERVTAFPPIAVRLLALFAGPSADVSEAAELIGSDAGLTARLLQRVNSVEFSLAYPLANVKQAITMLGLDLTRQLMVTHATAAYAAGAPRTAELRRCWQHSIATAVLAEEIAQSCDAFTNIAFTAGIMHDIGRLGLLVAYPEEYEGIIRDAAVRCLDILDFERQEFGLHHAEAGRLLAERWGFPDELRIVAGRHHDPCEGAELDLLRIVHVACRLADALGYDMTHPLVAQSVEDVLAELPARSRKRLRATPEQLCARIEERILEYDSDRSDPQPEPDCGLAEDAALEEEPKFMPGLDRQPASGSNLVVRLVLGTMAALATLAALLAWRMQ
jgi:putative nucleotidyltransferase with HDIG domain